MIVMHIMGGLGNQLFQYALGRCLAHKHNKELKLEIIGCENYKDWHHNYYRLDALNIQENFATLEELQGLKHIQESPEYERLFIPEIFNLPDNIFLNGYWQSEQYFIEIRDILLQELTLKNPLGKNSAAWKEKILSANCAVSLHVRLGDFMTPLVRNENINRHLGMDYYSACVNQLKEIVDDITLFVFSDDLDGAKKFLKFDVPTEFVEGCETDAEEMYLMSLCKHNIIPDSTFAWWGAWLNQNPNKMVFMPSSNTNTMQNSVSVPINENFKPLIEFPPMLSIIVYVENNLDTINISLHSILSQSFDDYELILVDASTDESSKICHQVTDERVTTLRVATSTNKFSAWNKGLEVARGDYVLFLTAKNFLHLKAVKTLAQFFYDYLKVYVETRGKYLFFANYNEDNPDVIGIVKSIEEDSNGAIDIGMPGKKFSLKVDKSFENIDRFAKVNSSSSEKLLALGTKSINNLVDTKFFKRQFLNDNNIRFQMGGGNDAELIFVVETFLKTEEIAVLPESLIGRLK